MTKGSHRSALRGMDPQEAFQRLPEIMETYFNLRLEALSMRVANPLDQLPELTKSENPRMARFASDLQQQLEWLRTWFPGCSPAQLIHIADLTSRAANHEMNTDPEERFMRIVVAELGTLRARNILAKLESDGVHRPARVKKPTRGSLKRTTRSFLRRVAER